MTIDTFDSRALRHTDCYGQRFMRPGTYRYDVVPSTWVDASVERPYTVTVVPEDDDAPDGPDGHTDGPMNQYNVMVHADGKHFAPDDAALTVRQGDLVLWHCPDAAATPFSVVGDKDFFGNTALVNECGFSHAFAAAGEYRWGDANGSGLGGVVRVTDPKIATSDDFKRWQRKLAEGALVMVAEGKVEPPEIQVAVGQTVYFAVVTGPGITVTDARLLPDDGHDAPTPTKPRAATKATKASKATKATKATKAATAARTTRAAVKR